MKPILLALCSALLILPNLCGQVIFSAPTQFGILLFQEQNGTITQLNTGQNEHNFPSISRDSRFVVFSTPDPVVPALQVPPSSDIYVFDRVLGLTRKIIDTTTQVVNPSEIQTFRPISAALSPDNQLLAYGLELSRRSGNSPNGTGRILTIASSATGLAISSPTDARGGAASDPTLGEFNGISWDPNGNSFVTPALALAASQSGNAFGLPAIWRVTRTPGGQWAFTNQLTTPIYNDFQFPPSAVTHIYPAISPSGAGLAYFELNFPDVLGGSQPVTARLIVANANGSNARVVLVFNPSFYPAGLAWSRDGTRLVFSIARQIQFGSGGFSTLVDPGTAVVRQIPTSGGMPTPVSGIGTGFFPSVPVVPLLPLFSPTPDLVRPVLKLRGGRTIETLRKRVVLRGTARDDRGVTSIDVKARGAKVQKVRLQSGDRFTVILQVKKRSGRVLVKLQAVDGAGLKSKQEKLRILRR